LTSKNREYRDDQFIKKLVDEMVEHRSPCHNLDETDVGSIKDVIKKYRKMERGFSMVLWGILLYIAKNIYDLLIVNLHWGGK